MNESIHVYVKLQQDADGYPPFEAEEIAASSLDNGRCRIDGIPVFVDGLACGDVVEVVHVQGDTRIWATQVLESGGHWTVRVLPWKPEALHSVAHHFMRLGCKANATQFGLVAVDVPPNVPARRIMSALEHGKVAGEWDFDLGVSPD
jgi:hypothetical protein